MPAFSCSSCGREFHQPLAGIVGRLRSGRTRCQLCGGELVFPEEARAALAGGGDDAVDLDALSRYTCEDCGKSWATSAEELERRRRTGCRFCGAPLSRTVLASLDALAARPTGPATRVPLECPICLRPTAVESPDPEELYSCQFCGAPFRPPAAEGESARRPPLTGPAASREEVAAITDRIRGQGEIARLVGDILLARVERGDVGAAEARFLADQLAVLSQWRPDPERAFLPLHVDEAVRAVPALLYQGQSHAVERHPDSTDLVFTIESRDRSRTVSRVNLFAFATLAFTGRGLFAFKREEQTPDQHRIRITLLPVEDGVQLVPYTQLNDERPNYVGDKTTAAFAGMVADCASALPAYYGTLALFGTWAAGVPAVSATAPAIARRLGALGLGHRATEWTPRLRAR